MHQAWKSGLLHGQRHGEGCAKPDSEVSLLCNARRAGFCAFASSQHLITGQWSLVWALHLPRYDSTAGRNPGLAGMRHFKYACFHTRTPSLSTSDQLNEDNRPVRLSVTSRLQVSQHLGILVHRHGQ